MCRYKCLWTLVLVLLPLSVVSGEEEQAHRPINSRQVNENNIVPADVMGVSEIVKEKVEKESVRPTGVFMTITQENRQANMMLEKIFQPNDVCIQVGLIVKYVNEILPKNKKIYFPEYVKKHAPTDVCFNLYECFLIIENIFKISEFKIMKIDIYRKKKDKTISSDAYDFSSIVLLEIACLIFCKCDTCQMKSLHDVQKKIRTHIYQYVVCLNANLEVLLKHVNENPVWFVEEKFE